MGGPIRAGGYLFLAFASAPAGNLPLFGSVANLIVFEGAGPKHCIGFVRFLKSGVILTTATLAIALGVLSVERALGW